MAATSHFLSFSALCKSLTAIGPFYMNERPKLGSEQGHLNVHLWVILKAYVRQNRGLAPQK